MRTIATHRRALGAAEIGYAAALALVPVTWWNPLAPGIEPRLMQRLARVLAGRQLAQGALTIGAPRPNTLGLGAAVDLLHAASMVALAAVVPAARRPAAASAIVAALAAARARQLRR